MKKSLLYLLPLVLFLINACNDDSSGNITSPFGQGLQGSSGGVSFTMSAYQGQNGGMIFTVSPSVAVKITKVTVSLPSQQFTDVLQGDGSTQFNANQAVELEEYTGVGSGQQWTFQFDGTLASNSQAFNVTANYTIP